MKKNNKKTQLKLKNMGSFYSTCSVSGMTLTHQETYVVLLVPTFCLIENNIKQWEHSQMFKKSNGFVDTPKPLESIDSIGYDIREMYLKKKGLLVSNEGALAVFTPFGFPIKGRYYDYGKIEDIERDDNVLILEEFFGLSIEEILEYASDNRTNIQKAKNKNILEMLSITSIRSEILEYLVKKYEFNSNYFIEVQKHFEDLENFPLEFRNKEWENIKYLEWDRIKNVRTFVNEMCPYNFIHLLPLKTKHFEDYKKLYYFLVGLSRLDKTLMPSVYGGQENNFKELIAFNKISIEILKKDLKDLKEQYDECYGND